MMGHGFFGGMWLWPLLLILVVIAGAFLIRGFSRGCCGTGQSTHGKAEEVLRERYARGEISREEFNRMRADLDSNKR